MLVGIATGIGAVMTFALWTLLSRSLDRQDFGIATTVISLANIAAFVGATGEEHAAVKYGLSAERGITLGRVFRVQATTIVIVIAAGVTLTARVLTPDGVLLALLLLPSLVFFGTQRVIAAFERRKGVYFPTYFAASLALGGPRLLAWLLSHLSGRFDLRAFGVLTSAISGGFVAFLTAFSGRRGARPSVEGGAGWSRQDWVAFSRRWRAHSFAQALLSWADIPLVALTAGAEAAGLYGFASRLAMAPRFVTTGLGTAYAAAMGTQDTEDLRADPLYRRVQSVGTAICMATAVAMALAAGTIFRYARQPLDRTATVVLLLVLFAIIVDAAFGPNAWALGYREGGAFIAKVEWLSAGVDLALVVLLVPLVGIEGAACAWLVAVVVGNVLRNRALQHRRTDATPLPF